MTAKVTAKRTRMRLILQPGAAVRAAGVWDVTAKRVARPRHGGRNTVPSNAAAGGVVTNKHSSSFALG